MFEWLWKWWNPQKTTNNPQEGVDFVLGEYSVGDESPPISTVKLLTGPYAGVEYCYLNVRVSEYQNNGQLSFKYSFLDTPGFHRDTLKIDQKFVAVAGTILESLLLREGGMNDTVGTNDPQESDL